MAKSGDDIVHELKAVAKAMRETGILKYTGHGLEILLGPEPVPAEKKEAAAKKGSDELRARREHYELQLGRIVSDQELAMLP